MKVFVHRLIGWRLLGAGAVVAVSVLIAVFVVRGGSGPAARARQYLSVTACLLTDSRGLAGPQAAAAWSGMEHSSSATKVQVELLSVPRSPAGGAGSTASAVGATRPLLASLALRHCAVIVTAGSVPAAAVRDVAGEFAAVRFVVVGHAATANNISAVSGSAAAIRIAVASAVTAAAVNG